MLLLRVSILGISGWVRPFITMMWGGSGAPASVLDLLGDADEEREEAGSLGYASE